LLFLGHSVSSPVHFFSVTIQKNARKNTKREPVMKTDKMTSRDAVRILMLSPIYFLLSVPQRLVLVREYCQAMSAAGF
jgi:hypothetical protein